MGILGEVPVVVVDPLIDEVGELLPKEFIIGEVSSRVEEFILEAPEYKHGRGTAPGDRAGGCERASRETLDVAGDLAQEGHKLYAVALQALQLFAAMPKGSKEVDLKDIWDFRRHGYTLIYDELGDRWWLSDRTFNQFVERKDNRLQMKGTALPIEQLKEDEQYLQPAADLAMTLMEDGQIELTRDKLAVYLILMVNRGKISEKLMEEMHKAVTSDSFAKNYFLWELIQKTKAFPRPNYSEKGKIYDEVGELNSHHISLV